MFADTQIAYLAGFFDGEGCIRLIREPKHGRQRVRYGLIISASQLTEKQWPLLLLRKTFGGTIHPKSVSGSRRPMLEWTAYGKTAASALALMFPYLTVKRERATWGMLFRAWKLEQVPNRTKNLIGAEEQAASTGFYKVVRYLNQRGCSTTTADQIN